MSKNLPRCEDSFSRMTQEDRMLSSIQFPLISVKLIICIFNSQQSLCVDKHVKFLPHHLDSHAGFPNRGRPKLSLLFYLFSMARLGNTQKVVVSRYHLLLNMTNGVKSLYYGGITKT
jgi:hypothetical protein